MKPKVFIRVDGNSTTGLGHLIRCIAAAHMIKNDFEIMFICRECPDKIADEIADKFGFLRIEKEDEYFNLLSKKSISVIDGYEFDFDYQKKIRGTGAKLVCIDDLHDKKYDTNLIINHAPGIKPEEYSAPLNTQFALGTDYALLRPEFLNAANNRREISKVETVFICFGGSDYNNFTEKALACTLKFKQFKKIFIVTGNAYLHSENLKKLVTSDVRVKQFEDINAEDMQKLMSESELAIVPSSGILLEALSVGCKIISGITADNQKFVYSNYLKSDFFIDAKDFNETDLKAAIEKSFTEKTNSCTKVDGKSGERLLKLFHQMASMQKLELTRAEKDDLEVTYEWAADPVVRAHSFTKSKIIEEEHSNWFKNKILDKNCLYLIANLDGNEIGSIRFDIKDDEAIISYLIDPEHHGKGLGQAVLANGLEILQSEYEKNNFHFHKVIGYVLGDNVPSVKTFERLGFTKITEPDRLIFQKEIQT